jgi:multicomponent Na+:H+ antiporter subunit G
MVYLVYVLMGLGLFFSAMSVVGLIRFPDIFTRLHAATKTTTFGSLFIVAAVVIKTLLFDPEPNVTLILHAIIALVVVVFTNPISAHAIARAALLSGIKPYGVKVNDLRSGKNVKEGKS